MNQDNDMYRAFDEGYAKALDDVIGLLGEDEVTGIGSIRSQPYISDGDDERNQLRQELRQAINDLRKE